MKAFEYKLEPTHCQELRFDDYLDCCHFIYNWALADRRDMFRIAKDRKVNFYDQSRFIKDLREAYPWLKDIHVHVLQDVLKRIQRAFDAFFRRLKNGEKPGYPRFKGRHYYDSFSFKEYGNGFRIDGKRLELSRIGRVRVRWHREIVGEIKTCTIKKKADGWYVCFAVEEPEVKPIPIPENPVGIDLGASTYATLSDGTKVGNPRLLRKASKKLKAAQRRVQKRQKRSKRRGKAIQSLRRRHQTLARQRKDFQFKLAKKLLSQYNPICVEDLDIKGMLEKWEYEDKRIKPRDLHRSIQDASWGQFLGILSGKAESAGSRIIRVEARGTTQLCSDCGHWVQKGIRQRWHSCPHCGLEMDRDLNASLNVFKKGMGSPIGKGAGSSPPPLNREAAPL